ncbi:MAG: phage baseplate assembly protein V [Rubritepida sp.]|nr:phage baseplate assembly protein V [Rubritepida sp.]
MMAGTERGTWFIPEPGDEVLVAFYAGDPSRPVVIGALWNGADAPPETMDAQNNIRAITSRSGHRVLLDDTAGAEKVEVETQGGHKLTLDDAAGGTITLEHSNGVKLTMDAVGNVELTANVKVTVNAPAQLSVTAGMVQVDAGMSRFSGVVQCDTLITNSVVSASYTPGAGNVW